MKAISDQKWFALTFKRITVLFTLQDRTFKFQSFEYSVALKNLMDTTFATNNANFISNIRIKLLKIRLRYVRIGSI